MCPETRVQSKSISNLDIRNLAEILLKRGLNWRTLFSKEFDLDDLRLNNAGDPKGIRFLKLYNLLGVPVEEVCKKFVIADEDLVKGGYISAGFPGKFKYMDPAEVKSTLSMHQLKRSNFSALSVRLLDKSARLALFAGYKRKELIEAGYSPMEVDKAIDFLKKRRMGSGRKTYPGVFVRGERS
ncbi:hypothetical protein KKG83_08175 [Candidatus Micrarchaeota archaeon]|nr:hypothetical protein [Candidatus Micrarchaeota archaeon]MBU2477418.1 hypothetical protein [Candidatus Micrarchaeota archaeon]